MPASALSGEAHRAPALDPVSCWRVERRDDIAYVREKIERAQPPPPQGPAPKSIVIVWGRGGWQRGSKDAAP
jgi:apoptosis-inducing factor 3